MIDLLTSILFHVALLALVAGIYALRLRAHYERWAFPVEEVPPFAITYLIATGLSLIWALVNVAGAIEMLGGFVVVNGLVILYAYLKTRTASLA